MGKANATEPHHLRVVFMGTSGFSLTALAALLDAGFHVVAVYTQAPKPAGRNYKIQKSPVHCFAEDQNIAVYVPQTLKSGQEESLRALAPDLAVVSSYGLIIPRDMLLIPTYGFINIHASLLPRWRGAAPIRSAILAGDSKTGITIMKMDAGVDTGDIIAVRSIDITPKTNHGELEERLGAIGAEMIVDVIGNLDESLSQARKQPEEGAVYAPKVNKKSSKIDWLAAAENILRQIKAFSPSPGAWCEISGLRIQILDAEIAANGNSSRPAGIVAEEAGMTVACGSGSLRLTLLRPAGKSKMSGEDFLRGHKNLIGQVAS
ncbi:MAG: methionyl-tRNA formyltransferase [Holosporaceae bacterium]|jgi:methionyl-tRNA formyltransferase|nr:methionyl-tRNA formyltransferase [Holosporaceae bacterium]